MKKRITLLCFIGLLISCSDFMEPYPNGGYTTDNIWEYQDMVQGLIAQCYTYMATNYNNTEGAYLDGATDNAVITNTSNAVRRMAVGALPASSDPFLDYWTRNYDGLYLANLFLKDN